MIRLSLFYIGFTVASAAAQASHPSTFCAVDLVITLGDGGMASSGTAELRDDRGRVVKVAPITAGKASFCDFGFGSYSIRVDSENTIPVILTGIRLIYGTTQNLAVILNPKSMVPEGGSGNACRAYIRAEGTDQRPIVEARATSHAGAYQGDLFGRFLLLVPLNRFVTFTFEKAGYKPLQLTLACSSWSEELTRTSEELTRTVYMQVAN
jgi:hypothetical protein